ncbi:MAG: LysR family transcriptional regulator [Desulfobulbaceae bacterium]|jgi:DNA-binding transcriptional LysR family regulator|nr:LysR family transcriptional regulator [Desulfobulbaceae bacterium]
MSITLRQLEIFIAVAETAQVTKASKKLFVTQSAVSMALAELENQLGGPLYDRHGRSLVLNARGRYLLPLAKEIAEQVNGIESTMTERNDSLEGQINVVASTTLGNYILPYLVGAFKRAHPRVHINLLVYNTSECEKMLLAGSSDIAYVEGLPSHNEDLQARPWFRDELVVLCGPSDPLSHKDVFDVKSDIRNKKWVMREKTSGTAAIFREKFKNYLDDINIVMEIGHPEAIKRAVESGAGIACLSNLCLAREVEHGWIKSLKVKGIDMRRQLQVIMRKDKVLSPPLTEFTSLCNIMSVCTQEERTCLSSPWRLQSLLARHSAGRMRHPG